MNNLANSNQTNDQLKKLQDELHDSMNRTLTKKDLIRLNTIDEGIVHFIHYVRQTMLWNDKHLNVQEIEVFFGMLDQAHTKIIQDIRKLIDEFAKENTYGRAIQEAAASGTLSKADSSESSDLSSDSRWISEQGWNENIANEAKLGL